MSVDVTVVVQRQVPTIQTVQNTVEVPQNQDIDPLVDVHVGIQRQKLMIRKAQSV